MHVLHPLHQRWGVQQQATNTHRLSSILLSRKNRDTQLSVGKHFFSVCFGFGFGGSGVFFFCLFYTQKEHCTTDSPGFTPKREINRGAFSDKAETKTNAATACYEPDTE